ncbi:hypothetical protein Hanom_Chr10g00899771 [Helianthus anomalus]
MKLEMEALRADKAVKDEQLNMLYTIQRVDERRIARESELAQEATQRRKGLVIDIEETLGSSSQSVAGRSSSQADVEMVDAEVNEQQSFVLVGDSTPLSYNFEDIIRLVRVEQRKRKVKEPEMKYLCWREETEEEREQRLKDEELKEALDAVDNYDPSWDNYEEDDDD